MKDIDKNILIRALDHLPVGTLIVDARQEHWPVVYMNSIVGQLTGLDVGALVGSPWRGLLVDPEGLAPQRERLLASPALVVRHLRQRWQSRSGEPLDMSFLPVSFQTSSSPCLKPSSQSDGLRRWRQ